MRVVSASNDTDRRPAVAKVSTAGCTAGSAAGVAATCCQASACSTTAGARMLGQQRRPPGKRRPARRQGYRLPAAMLGPGDVEVLQHNPPRHPVDGQMVNDQHQLAAVGHPQRAAASPRRPGSTATAPPAAPPRTTRPPLAGTRAASTEPGLGHLQRPAPGAVICRRAAATWHGDPARPATPPPRRPRSPPPGPAPPASG